MLRSKIQRRDINKTTRLRRREGAQPISIQEMNDGEFVILKAVQHEFDLDTSPSSPLAKLDPYTDSNGVIRVGGRLNLSDVLGQVIHPTILPRTGHVTNLIIKHFQKVQHQGRGMTTNEIRASGYWIVGAISVVPSAIRRCVTCRRLRGTVEEQRMAELPYDRLEPAPPFTNCAVD